MVTSILLGWVPGPGGIPLFLVGLGLLSMNHQWAADLQKKIRSEGTRFLDKVFTTNPKVQILYDFIALTAVSLGIWAIINGVRGFDLYVPVMSILIGLVLFLGNRSRWPRLKRILGAHPD